MIWYSGLFFAQPCSSQKCKASVYATHEHLKKPVSELINDSWWWLAFAFATSAASFRIKC